MKYQFEIPLEEHVSGKNLFWSSLIGKSRERKRNEFPHCPFELSANQHSQSSPDGQNHTGISALKIISNIAILLVILYSTTFEPMGSRRVSNGEKN